LEFSQTVTLATFVPSLLGQKEIVLIVKVVAQIFQPSAHISLAKVADNSRHDWPFSRIPAVRPNL